jgi:ATP-dependent Zn protease
MMAIGALLRLLTSVPEVRRRDIGLSTDPMRSITDSGTVLGKVSERTRQRVDEVVKRIVGEAHDQAARLVADNRDRLAMRSPRR